MFNLVVVIIWMVKVYDYVHENYNAFLVCNYYEVGDNF